MCDLMSDPPLAEQPWLADYLSSHGFVRISPSAFRKGTSSIQLEGDTLLADPGGGEEPWRAELAGTNPVAIKLVLQLVLKVGAPKREELFTAREPKTGAMFQWDGGPIGGVMWAAALEDWTVAMIEQAEETLAEFARKNPPNCADREMADLFRAFAVVRKKLKTEGIEAELAKSTYRLELPPPLRWPGEEKQ